MISSVVILPSSTWPLSRPRRAEWEAKRNATPKTPNLARISLV